MARYKLTNKAVEDLTHIWNYTFEKWSENQADTYYNMLLENCKELAGNPGLVEILFGNYTKLIGI